MGIGNGVELDDLEVAGPRLLLRRWHADDAARVREVMQDRSMYEFLTLPFPYDDAAAREFVTSIGHEGRDDGSGFGCAVAERSSGRVVASAALRLGAEPEIGYWVAPDARGHGYATECCEVLAELGFGRLGLARISIACDVRNLASARTALAAGFRFEGAARDAAPVAGRGRAALARFGRLADDPVGAVAPAFARLPTEGLRDGTITVRPIEPDDADQVLEIERDEVTVAVGFTGEPAAERDVHGIAERAGLDWLVGGAARMAVVDDATGGVAGAVTLRLAGPPAVYGLGYSVHPLFRGRGYTARALRLLAPWAFATGAARLELGAKVDNVASQRAALAAGFHPDGVRRHRLRNADGSFSDEARFALLPPGQSARPTTSGTSAASPTSESPSLIKP